MQHAASIPPGERIVAMDVLRGFALLGICVVHMPHFGMVSSDAMLEGDFGRMPAVDRWAAWTQHLFFVSRSFPLFSILFGMGMVLQMRSAARAGRDFVQFYRRRLALLALFGLAHGVLLFPGDVLFLYSVAGCVLLAWRHGSPRAHIAGAMLLFGFGVVLTLGLRVLFGGGMEEVVAPVWTASEAVTLEQLASANEANWDAFERKAYAVGPIWSTLLVNAAGFAAWLVEGVTSSYDWRVLGFFLLGAALMKLEFFGDAWRPWHARMATVGLGVGIPISFAGLWLGDSASPSLSIGALLLNGFGSLFMVAGYLGVLTCWARSGRFTLVLALFAAAGRTALTNYVLQSVVANVLFRWFGFGWFERFSYGALCGIAVLVFTAQAACSAWWLRRFRMGPLEWVCRRGAYGRGFGRPA